MRFFSSQPSSYRRGLFDVLFLKEETAKQMRERIRSEIEAENFKRLRDPSLYLNTPKNVDGSLRESEREQIGA